MSLPPAPKGSGSAGKKLWQSVVSDFELEEHEAVQLREAVRLVDLLTDLQTVLDKDGAVITDTKGEPRVHPAAIELRQGRIALARLLSALRLPSGEESEGSPQRRSGARGVYQLHQRKRSA
jgi:hypothetical protein